MLPFLILYLKKVIFYRSLCTKYVLGIIHSAQMAKPRLRERGNHSSWASNFANSTTSL